MFYSYYNYLSDIFMQSFYCIVLTLYCSISTFTIISVPSLPEHSQSVNCFSQEKDWFTVHSLPPLLISSTVTLITCTVPFKIFHYMFITSYTTHLFSVWLILFLTHIVWMFAHLTNKTDSDWPIFDLAITDFLATWPTKATQRCEIKVDQMVYMLKCHVMPLILELRPATWPPPFIKN